MASYKTLLAFLVQEGVIEKRVTLHPEAVVRHGLINEIASHSGMDPIALLTEISHRLSIPILDLDDWDLRKKIQEQKMPSSIIDLCVKHNIVPLYKEQEKLLVATENPLDLEAMRTLEFALSSPVSPVLASGRKLAQLLEILKAEDNKSHDMPSILAMEAIHVALEQVIEVKDSDDVSNSSPVVRLCNLLIAQAVDERASDIHLEPSQEGLDVRLRIDGVMKNLLQLPSPLRGPVVSRFKIMASLDIAQRRKPQDGRFRASIAGKEIDLRISVTPVTSGEKIVIRLLGDTTTSLSFESLGIPRNIEQPLIEALHGSGRLVLVTGPTGSGKTTTLYTCLHHLKDGTTNIATVEDPVEYRIAGVNQTQVHDAIGVTFSSALRSILRQDPDVIMVGEIRDRETADVALQAAQTGHVVLSTLHTNDALSAAMRLLSFGIDAQRLASGLAGVVAQRLVRKLCVHCRTTPQSVNDPTFNMACAAYRLQPVAVEKGVGCSQCRATGYKGRTGVFSFLNISQGAAELFNRGAGLMEIEQFVRREGFQTLEHAALLLATAGVTSLEEVREYLILRRIPELSLLVGSSISPEGSQETAKGLPRRQKVVIIEDDPHVRAVFVQVLLKDKYEVFEAENGYGGLELVYEHNPALVICDLRTRRF